MGKKNTTVSVIIPTYNRAHLLGRSIRSVLNQTYQDLEIIVIDDASTDNTKELILNIDNRKIRYIRHEKNMGSAAARNTGIKVARGSYIAFQDSDDEWLPDKLKKQIEVFETASEKVGMVYSDMWRMNGINKCYFHSPNINPEDGLIYEQALDYAIINIGIQTALIKKVCFTKAGLFDVNLKGFDDSEFFMRLSKYYYFYHIKEPLVNYFKTHNSIVSNREAHIAARKIILLKYFDDINKNSKLLAKHYSSIGLALTVTGDIKNGRDYLIKSLKIYPFNLKIIIHTIILFCGNNIYNKLIYIYRKIKR